MICHQACGCGFVYNYILTIPLHKPACTVSSQLLHEFVNRQSSVKLSTWTICPVKAFTYSTKEKQAVQWVLQSIYRPAYFREVIERNRVTRTRV